MNIAFLGVILCLASILALHELSFSLYFGYCLSTTFRGNQNLLGSYSLHSSHYGQQATILHPLEADLEP